MGDVKSPGYTGNDHLTFHEEKPGLNGMVNELATISDVCGAFLVDNKGAVIAQHINEHIVTQQCIETLALHSALRDDCVIPGCNMNGMFSQQVVYYDGHTLLVRRITHEALLLILVAKKAYIGLTILDMEGYLREKGSALLKANT